jgi:hypothetical protein
VTIGCDNMMAGKYGIEWESFPQTTLSHFDMKRALHCLKHELKIEGVYEYVEGHQKERDAGRKLLIQRELIE